MRHSALYSGLPRQVRDRAIRDFRSGEHKVLVASDAAARGLDFPTVGQVILFDFPLSVTEYLHRIGRTGRAGKAGTVVSFVHKRDEMLAREIEAFLGHKRATSRRKPAQPETVSKPRGRPTGKAGGPKRGDKRSGQARGLSPVSPQWL